jgi:hypothetical protein
LPFRNGVISGGIDPFRRLMSIEPSLACPIQR